MITSQERAFEKLWEGIEVCCIENISIKDLIREVKNQYIEWHRQQLDRVIWQVKRLKK